MAVGSFTLASAQTDVEMHICQKSFPANQTPKSPSEPSKVSLERDEELTWYTIGSKRRFI